MAIVTDKIFTVKDPFKDFEPELKSQLAEIGIDTQPRDDTVFYDFCDECFLCGKQIATFPAVMWHGYRPVGDNSLLQIWFHPECAKSFCERLMRDYSEIKLGKTHADCILRRKKKQVQKNAA